MATITELGTRSVAVLATSTDSASVTLSGAPVIVTFGVANSVSGFNITGVVWNGAAEALTQLGADSNGTQAGTDTWYIDAPTPGTNTFTVSHGNLSSRRNICVYEITDQDTSSSSAWRDAPVTDNAATTDAETAVSSATGDTPVLFITVRVSSSSPTLTLNGTSTSLTGFLGGTTLRSYACYGTGAASVTLGGTLTGAASSAAVGLNLNSAVVGGGAVVRLVSSSRLTPLVNGGLV